MKPAKRGIWPIGTPFWRSYPDLHEQEQHRMAFGLDYVTAPSITAMKAAGVTFVCRYLSEVNDLTKIKLLTPEEAKADSEAGIALVSNYEWYANRALEGHTSGIADAQIADAQHKVCGGPAERPIYFSVDFNATSAQMAAIIDYFHGVASVIGLQRTGAYGSYETVKTLFDAGAITWGWQTYAWSNGQWDPRAHIRQTLNRQTLDNHSVDYDESMQSDFGQWFFGGIMIPQGWNDDGTTLTAPNGHKVVLGFRDYVLKFAEGWPNWNQPQEEEWHASPLELSNPSLGDGQKQCFNATTLEWTSTRGVFEAWQGQEIVALRAEIATLKAQSTTPVDTTALVAAINAIPDAIAPVVATALVEAKKL